MKALQNEGEGFMLAYDDTGELEEKKGNEICPLLKEVLEEFEEIFKEPTQLPPQRECDHAITWKEGSKIPNIRPYRYPYYKKKMK